MRLNTKFAAIVVTLCFVIPLALGYQKASAATPEQKFTLKYTTTEPDTSAGQKLAVVPLLQEIEKNSGGRITFQMNWAQSLLKANEEYEGIINGVADVGRTILYTQSNLYQLLSLGMLPYAGKDPANIYKAITEIINKGYANNDLKGLHLFCTTGTSSYAFLFRNKKPMTLSELSRMKVRNPGGYMGSMLTALGATPVGLTSPEIYDALSKNMIEAVYWMRDSFVAYKTYEMGKYLLNFDANVFSTVVVIMNEKTWNSLPKDLQDICTASLSKLQYKNVEAFSAGDTKAIDVMKKAGIEIYDWPKAEIDKARTAILPIWEQAIKDMDKRGMSGKQIMTEYVGALNKLGENPPWKP
jgi:TRAP-type C4-dicarboxylate transport system substrate-binding protein